VFDVATVDASNRLGQIRHRGVERQARSEEGDERAADRLRRRAEALVGGERRLAAAIGGENGRKFGRGGRRFDRGGLAPVEVRALLVSLLKLVT
jgi:hypothetical protein